MNATPIKVGISAYQSQGLLGCEGVLKVDLCCRQSAGECFVSVGMIFCRCVGVGERKGSECSRGR